jgi:hypothetical protein
MAVNRQPPLITLEGTPYGVTDEEAVFVDVLLNKLGEWVDPAAFEEESLLKGGRRDRIKKRLPKPIRDLIEGKRGGGYRMRLA